MKLIIQKAIAQSGYSSRRKAEKLVEEKKVKVNNQLATPGQIIETDTDKVLVKGKKINFLNELIYIKLNKPKGYVCTNREFDGEQNIFELININERIFTIGRLDKQSRGLVILTNDGHLTEKISHPRYQHSKRYIVKIKEDVKNFKMIENKLLKGVDIGEGNGIARVKMAKYLQDNKFELILTEGKKRQIRRMFELLGLKIKDLLRVEISGVKLGNLKEGEWIYLTKEELNTLKKK
ncbi:MAG: pseudouridine synthase [Patescibacteria group bacterium]|jgi:pseudouridine synthase|nr:pseudouridine synthase [Patescibacteria group bacterium]